MRRLSATALVGCLAVCACGSGTEAQKQAVGAHKQAVIAAALRALQTEEEQGLAQARRVQNRREANVWTELEPAPPEGISEAAWKAAIKGDRALGPLDQSIRNARASIVRQLEDETGKPIYLP